MTTAKLSYSMLVSLDGYVADAGGRFDWAAPDEEVHAFVNDLERPVGTYLYGRRMYEVMEVWQTMPLDDEPAVMRNYAAIWREAEKVVYSTSLGEVATPRTRLERDFDPVAVRELKEVASADLSVGGPDLAAQALRAGLVDELHLFVNPVLVGAGNAALPHGLFLQLELLDEHRFVGGVVHLHYRVGQKGGPA